MFDQRPGAAPDSQAGAEPEKNYPTPPPMPSGEGQKIDQGQGVEDIFSPIASENVSENKPTGVEIGAGIATPPGVGMDGDDIKLPPGKKPAKKGGSKILIFVLIFILVSAIGTAAWYYLMYLPSQAEVVEINDQAGDMVNDNSVVNTNINQNTNPVPVKNNNINTNPVPVKNTNTNTNVNINENTNTNTNTNANINTNTNPVSTVDTDSDGLTDVQEMQLKTNPVLLYSSASKLCGFSLNINFYI